ncbi:hypothetical protein COJ87_19880 [Bacillus cereus]|uniref:DUF2971 domain-containing protein n=1 Tax=Bacillus cereus TaxID=1396 RepID=UPI000BED625B|nr:DUF2971 domain-containing protein [Bacillus cereus]PEC89400.1 hypothetical protein CON02_20175 [Bacillus cereus]PFO03475.1 hypothetical protein COJ68_01655 [Bacillus cereus]PFO75282.1 hypothetical protein COJ87_19880 [Bacillus cereus]PGN75017.1 hypothetical protein CN963_28225 [Bacillus cereus]
MDYFYHYTSVESLALILKNRTFRLNNLADMDDLEEGHTTDMGRFGRCIYVSSWTDDSRESIPLWAMYTPNMQGVRIKMKKKIFEAETLKKDGKNVKEDITYAKGLINVQKENNIIILPPFIGDFIKVEYTDEESKLHPSIVEMLSPSEFNISLKDIGKYKRSSWYFQKEWRYRIKTIPFTHEQLQEMQLKQIDLEKYDLILNALRDEGVKALKYLDLGIANDAFADMEILCGPKITAGQKIIVEDLVEKYNPAAKILQSELKIR